LVDDGEVIQAKAKLEIYQEIDSTKEYAETQYFGIKEMDTSKIVQFNEFWIAFLDHLILQGEKKEKINFVSIDFKIATNTYSELLLALAVIDLPF